MALAPVVTILPHRRRRGTYKRRPVLTVVAPVVAPRPAAHRALHTAKQVAAIRRRRARVLAVQAWVTTNVRLLVAGIAGGAVFGAAVVLLLGMSDDRLRTVLAVGAVIGFLAYSLDAIAKHTTGDSEVDE